ncbi:MAG: ABC transporter ATP-binding protein [Bacilli bacterium]|nr:ABC transporter ATP-binding protein [Bacilli bacterium]
MISVKNVKKEFIKTEKNKKKTSFYAVNDISFTVERKEILGILGPNGAGKTTLLRMIGGIMEPTKGNITYDNKSFQENEIEIKKEIAYLSGNTKIYNTISPYELLKMCLEFYEYKGNHDKRIKEISKVLEMDQFLYNKIENLSTGQTQRVNIARCLIHNPNYYILDEATSGLDIMSSEIILDFIKKERDKGKTILYSTHYMEEAENICDRVIMINKGKILMEGTPNEIKEKTNTSNLRDSFFKLIGGLSYEE